MATLRTDALVAGGASAPSEPNPLAFIPNVASPDGEVSSTVRSVLDAMWNTVRTPAAALLVDDDGGVLRLAGWAGIAQASALDPTRLAALGKLTGPRVLRASELDSSTAFALGPHACWLVAPFARGSRILGIAIAACPDHAVHERNLATLKGLTTVGVPVVKQAQVFARVRELSLDTERQRLAEDLHDGVVQTLVHLRLRMQALARSTPDGGLRIVREAGQLATLLEEALTDIRSCIFGLRSLTGRGGLSAALRSYLRDLSHAVAPALEFAVDGDVVMSPDIEAEMFRIAQEAISNAVRHASAGRVLVRLQAANDSVVLLIEDDGLGIGRSASAQRGTGLGLEAMRRRAARVGARLAMTAGSLGGTRVVVTMPLKGGRER